MDFRYSLALILLAVVFTSADQTGKTENIPVTTDAENGHPKPKTTTTHQPTTTTETTPTTPITTPTTPTTPTTKPTTPTPPPTTPTPPPTTPTPPPTTHSPPPTTPAPTQPPTTHVPPPTTPSPGSDSWVVKDVNGTVCIIASVAIKITVPYKALNKTVNAEFSLDKVENATATGVCGAIEQNLTLSWENITTTFTFRHNKENSSYLLGSIDVDILVNNHTFPNNSMVNATKVSLTHNAQVFIVPLNHSYICSSLNPLTLNGSIVNGTTPLNGTVPGSITVSKVHVEAFGLGKESKYSAPMDCSPFETPDIVPIVVGLVLSGLVVVVLIAYLVGRKRAQARGYLSM